MKETKPIPIQDKFVAKPEEINKQAAIDKLYYHYEQQPKVDDKDQLSFLDEIADLEDDEDEKL
jgi:hypothetical protein